MRHLVEQIQTLEARLREGGGAARIDASIGPAK